MVLAVPESEIKLRKSLLIQFKKNYGSLVADPDVTMPIFFNPSYSIELNALANTTLLAHEYLKNENLNKDPASVVGLLC